MLTAKYLRIIGAWSGRRLDFEAVSRAHFYCRTDYAIGQGGPTQITDMQNVTLNTLAYQSFQGSETRPARFLFLRWYLSCGI